MPVTHTGTGGTASVVRRPPTLTRTPRAPTLTATTRLRSPHPGAHADPVSSRGSFAGSPRGWAVRLPLTLRRSAMGWELPVARGPRVGCGRSTGGRTRVTVGPLASLQAGVGWGPGRVIQTRWDDDKDSGDDEHRAGSGPRPTLRGTPSRPAGSKTQRLLLRPWRPPVEGPTCEAAGGPPASTWTGHTNATLVETSHETAALLGASTQGEWPHLGSRPTGAGRQQTWVVLGPGGLGSLAMTAGH